MLKYLLDENFNNNIYRGISRSAPEIDIVRVQDCGLAGAPDPEVLDYAAGVNRVLLTHDVHTLTNFALQRIKRGEEMSGLIEVNQNCSTSTAIEQIIMAAECLQSEEMENQILYIPL